MDDRDPGSIRGHLGARVVLAAIAALVAATLALEAWYGVLHPLWIFQVGWAADVRDGHVVVAAVSDTSDDGSATPAVVAGMAAGDRIVAVEDGTGTLRPVTSWFEWGRVLLDVDRRSSWSFEVERVLEGGEPERRRITIEAPDRLEPSPVSVVLFAIALVTALTALLVGFGRPDSPQARDACALFLAFNAVCCQLTILYPPGLREVALLWQTVLRSLVLYFFMRFFLLFPRRSRLLEKAPWLLPAGTLVGGFLAVLNVAGVVSLAYSFERFESFQAIVPTWVEWVGAVLYVGLLIVGFAALVLAVVRAPGADERRRMVILLAGAGLGLGPILALGVAMAAGVEEPSTWVVGSVLAAMLLFPLSFAYVVIRHRVLGIRLILRRGLQYLLVSRGVLATEVVALVVVFWLVARPLLGGVGGEPASGLSLVLAGLLALATTAGLRWLHARVMPNIDRRFFRDAYDAERVLAELADGVRRQASSPADLLETVTRTLGRALNLEAVAVFLRAPAHRLWPSAGQEVAHGDFVSGQLWRHPGAGVGSGGSEALPLVLPAETPLARLVGGIDPSEPAAVELERGHPELLRRPPGERAIVEALLRAQRRTIDAVGLRLAVPMSTRASVIGFLALGGKLSEEAFTGHDRQLVLGVAGQAAVAIDYAQMIAEEAERVRLQQELRLAREVQDNLLPAAEPILEGYRVEHTMLPAREVAGDFVQFLAVSERELVFVMGDVSGKGLHAAMLAAVALGGARAIVSDSREPAVILSRLNEVLREHRGRGFVTCLCGHLDAASGRLRLANAGHPYPFLRRSAGAPWASLQGPEPRLPLGVRGGLEYGELEVGLDRGGDVVLFSDGVVEAGAPDGEPLGFERLHRALAKADADGRISNLVVATVERHRGDRPQDDDISILALRRDR